MYEVRTFVLGDLPSRSQTHDYLAFSKDVSGWIPDEKDAGEEELLRLYRSLHDEEKDVVLRMVRGLLH